MDFPPGSPLFKPVSAVLGVVATLLVMAAPQAASRPVGCNPARLLAADGAPLPCPVRAGAACKPFLA